MDEIPQLFNELLFALSNDKNKTVYEDHKVIRINNFQCSEQKDVDLLNLCKTNFEKNGLGTCVLSGEILRDIELEKKIDLSKVRDDVLTFVVRKAIGDGFYYFITSQGLSRALEEQEFVLSARKIWVAEKFVNFSTITCDFLMWNSNLQQKIFEWQGLSDPRKLVRDLSIVLTPTVPVDIRPWLLRPDQKITDSNIFDIWKLASVKNLLFALPSEIRFSTKENRIVLKGEKSREINVSSIEDTELFQVLHDCAEWIYINRHDAEIKHNLLNYQLASEWIDEKKWPNKLYIEKALSSAHESYNLHSLESGRELLKAYDEIKKSLLDEVSKVSENTRGLVTNFWRDFAIAGGILVLNFATSNGLSSEGVKVIYTSVAGFLILSMAITIVVNARFNKIMKDNRDMWHEKLYPFIDKKNLDNIFTSPIEKGLKTYYGVVIVTLIIYIAMALYLLYLAYVVN